VCMMLLMVAGGKTTHGGDEVSMGDMGITADADASLVETCMHRSTDSFGKTRLVPHVPGSS